MWFCSYLVANGMITWLPTLYKQVFHLPLQTSLAYVWTTSAVGVAASVACALLIDKVGRKRWYAAAFLLAVVPLVTLTLLGASSAVQILVGATTAYAILQTIAFSLYLYSAELYPPGSARSAPDSAATGSGRDQPSDPCSSASSSPPSESSTSSRPSPSSPSSAALPR